MPVQSMHGPGFRSIEDHTFPLVEPQAFDNPNMSTLAERLRTAREEAGLSKAELGRKAGVRSASTLTELERGEVKDSAQLPAIAEVLGVDVLWLQHGRGPKRRSPTPVEPGDSRLPVRRVLFRLSAGVSGYEVE